MLALTKPKNKLAPRASRTADLILERLLRHAMGAANSGTSATAWTPSPCHREKIARAVDAGRRLDFLLPAFPAKSPNREKTLGPLPDYADVLGLERLEALCADIHALHAPGARALICSDGRVFSDLVRVPESDVTAYAAALRKILDERGMQNISLLSLEQFYEEGTGAGAGAEVHECYRAGAVANDFSTMRARLVAEFGRSVEEIRAEAHGLASTRDLCNGIHRFLFEDRIVLSPPISRSRAREETKELAYRVVQRSNAWSALVESVFPQAVRLSIHPQAPGSAKLGFRLVESENAWCTPWHTVALLTPSGFRLVKRREAEARGAHLALAYGRYAYFVEDKRVDADLAFVQETSCFDP